MKLLFTASLCLCVSIAAHCQKAIEDTVSTQVITTVDEYNYLTKGLKRTLEEGADAKSGYTLQQGMTIKHRSGHYEFTFRPFVKNETNKIVAISVVVKSTQWSTNVYYLCIPRGNTDLVNQYWTSISTWDAPITKAYAEYTSLLFAESFGQAEEKK